MSQMHEYFQERAHQNDSSSIQCSNEIDFESASYYDGRASAFREAARRAKQEADGEELAIALDDQILIERERSRQIH